jgi:predicted nucleic acid-binding protein
VIVVDCSALVDVLAGAPSAGSVFERLRGEELHAPSLLDYEVVSVLRSLVLRRALSSARAEDALTDLADLPLTRWPSGDGLRRRSLALRDNLSAYDAAYVALAEALACPLITRDGRLGRARGHDAAVEVL